MQNILTSTNHNKIDLYTQVKKKKNRDDSDDDERSKEREREREKYRERKEESKNYGKRKVDFYEIKVKNKMKKKLVKFQYFMEIWNYKINEKKKLDNKVVI